MEESENPQVSEEQRKRILTYLQLLQQAMKELIEDTRHKIKQNEEDFDHITKCLQEFKDSSVKQLQLVSVKAFDSNIKLEEQVYEWQKIFKNDSEVYSVLQANVQVLTDWKAEMKVYLAKSPLIKNSLI